MKSDTRIWTVLLAFIHGGIMGVGCMAWKEATSHDQVLFPMLAVVLSAIAIVIQVAAIDLKGD